MSLYVHDITIEHIIHLY